MAIFRPKPSQIFFFGLVPRSPIHIGLIYVKNPKPNISCLGPFKVYVHFRNPYEKTDLMIPNLYKETKFSSRSRVNVRFF
jgi:hypothetical protein